MEVLHHEDFNLGANFTLAAWSFTNGLPQQHIGLPRKEAEYVLHPTQGGDAFNLRVYIGQGARGMLTGLANDAARLPGKAPPMRGALSYEMK